MIKFYIGQSSVIGDECEQTSKQTNKQTNQKQKKTSKHKGYLYIDLYDHSQYFSLLCCPTLFYPDSGISDLTFECILKHYIQVYLL